MRIGQNPAKFVKEVVQPKRITVAVLTYIPFLSGYYAESLDVLKLCLGSLWQNTDLPYDLMVVDNGSCQETIDYLTQAQDEGKIQYLVLSEKNVGKGGAWNLILAGAPGEIIAYTDSDAYFYPGWLSHSVELLEHFPNVGMVTARPFRTHPPLYSSTLDWAQKTPGVEMQQGKLLDWETFRSFSMSLGISEEETAQNYETSQDVTLSYQGKSAYVGASHWQFVAYKSVLQQFLPFDMNRPMGQVRQLDQRMNEAGYLRLMNMQPLAQNMSNTLSSWVLSPDEAKKTPAKAPSAFSKKLLAVPLVKRVLLGLYDRIFRWYYA